MFTSLRVSFLAQSYAPSIGNRHPLVYNGVPHTAHLFSKVTEKFVLRRTKDVIRGSLPPALEVVIFCRPSARQLSLYERCIASSGAKALLFDDELGGPDPEADKQRRLISLRGVLPLISTLRRLCNHPDLVFESSFGRAGDANDENVEEIFQDVARADGDDLDFFFVDDEDVEVDTSQDSLRDTNVAGATGGVRRGRGEHVLATNTACGKENGAAIATSGCGRGSTGSWKVPRFSGTATGTAAGAGAGTTASNALGLEVDKLATPKYETEASGKVAVLEALLSAVRREYPGDKVRLLCESCRISCDVRAGSRGRKSMHDSSLTFAWFWDAQGYGCSG